MAPPCTDCEAASVVVAADQTLHAQGGACERFATDTGSSRDLVGSTASSWRVAVLLGFEDAKLLGWIYLALRHKLGTWLHRYAMDWRIQGWTHLALFTVCVRLF